MLLCHRGGAGRVSRGATICPVCLHRGGWEKHSPLVDMVSYMERFVLAFEHKLIAPMAPLTPLEVTLDEFPSIAREVHLPWGEAQEAVALPSEVSTGDSRPRGECMWVGGYLW